MRPEYHITPQYGFLNDPNGLSQYHGKYHVFYQWLPNVIPRGSKRWRHCVSEDLIHWTDEECGLEPTEWYEKNGCYSGSGIVADDRYYLFYTGNVRDAEGRRETYQCMSVSEDGKKFAKKGPVIYLPEAYTPHFRDPKVWRKDGRWWMAVGAQTKEQKGNVALFVSDDLQSWNWMGHMLDNSLDWGYMCECPDIIEVQEKEFLVLSRQKEEDCKVIVLSGKMDYLNGKCTVNEGRGKLLDDGFDFYAPQSFTDESGRCLLFGWLGSGEEKYQMSQPSVREGWLHSLTIPREVYVSKGELCHRPAEELKALRKAEQVLECRGVATVDRGTASLEILMEDLKGQNISYDIGGVLKICYRKEDQTIGIQRKRWNSSGYDERTLLLDHLECIHIFLDHSTAEIFINNGKTTFTSKAYFGANTKIQIFSEEKIKIRTWLLEVA